MSSREEELKKQRSGHRERVRRRFLDEGLDGFKDYEALEMLLFYAVPRQDTKVIAKRLIDQFGSLQAVFHTPPDRLMQEAGLTVLLPLQRRGCVAHLPRHSQSKLRHQ